MNKQEFKQFFSITKRQLNKFPLIQEEIWKGLAEKLYELKPYDLQDGGCNQHMFRNVKIKFYETNINFDIAEFDDVDTLYDNEGRVARFDETYELIGELNVSIFTRIPNDYLYYLSFGISLDEVDNSVNKYLKIINADYIEIDLDDATYEE